MIGGATMTTNEAVEKYSEQYDVPKDLINAIIEVESSGNSYAVRYEKNYRWLAKPLGKYHWHTPTEKISQKTSWGLMQIMGAVARERGFEGKYLAELCNPEMGVKYGVKHLKWQYKRYGNWEDAVSAYNQGNNKKINGEYKNQSYVDKVMRLWGDDY